ncbi:unnamed protein product [Somion occarium]|uniref:Decapping nuclease n=1 Tax=Somion occarium TaxID=3059160 RepID=A0ABP1EAY9_9APHY
MLSRKRSTSAESESRRTKPRLCSIDADNASQAMPQTAVKLAYSTVLRMAGPISPVAFQQPSSLLTFSYSPSHELEFTDSALRYYVHPPRNADLRHGYDRWIRRPEERGRIDNLLRAVIRVRTNMDAQDLNGAGWLRDIGIVSWRGVMTKIMTAPYEERDSWELNVMMVDGTLYFEEHLTENKLAEKNNVAPHHRMQMYYGYAFESYCTSSTPAPSKGTAAGTWGGDVNTNVQWCSVVKTKLGDTRIVIGGEVDCVRGHFTGNTDSFVELKTSLIIRGAQDEAHFEKKLLKFYFQSFLLGVPIVVGFRTAAGRLSKVQSFRTMEIPRLVRNKPGAWDPLVCLDWGKRFIELLKSTIVSRPSTLGDPLPVWRVKFTPRSGVTISPLDKPGLDEVVNGEDRVGFLPQWYFDDIRSAERRSSELHPSVNARSAGPNASPEKTSTLPPGWQI